MTLVQHRARPWPDKAHRLTWNGFGGLFHASEGVLSVTAWLHETVPPVVYLGFIYYKCQ
jgi:hypothetical protein